MSFWKFIPWFNKFPRWDTIGWLVIIGVGAYWEIMGAVNQDRTTFTNLIRNSTPIWTRALILAVLIWHFCIAKANFKP